MDKVTSYRNIIKLSCDNRITEMKQARCYRRLAPSGGHAYFSAMNPTLFVRKLEKGEVK